MEQEKIKLLKEKSTELDSLKSSLAAEKIIFEKNNAGLIKEIQMMEDSYNTTKDEIKIQAVEEFEKTGQKKLLGGIGIRILKKIFYDESVAIDWANMNMSVAVKQVLDKRQFETYAKSTELDFVKKEESITVTFPKEIII